MRGTKAACEAFTASTEEVVRAYAIDTEEIGILTNGTWVWISNSNIGTGELLMQDGVISPPVPIENEIQDDWLFEG
jgi:hypothetical protein